MKISWESEHFQHASQHWPSVHFLCHTKYRSTSIQSRFAIYQYGCSRYLHHFLQKGMLESITSFDFSVIIINVNIEIVLCSKTFPTVFTVVLKQGWKMNTSTCFSRLLFCEFVLFHTMYKQNKIFHFATRF